jgi:hypothetical protein
VQTIATLDERHPGLHVPGHDGSAFIVDQHYRRYLQLANLLVAAVSV